MLGFVVVGMLYFSFSIVLRDFFSARGYDFLVEHPERSPHGNTPLVIILEVTYLVLLFQVLLLSLTVGLDSAKAQLKCISIFFGVMMMFFLFVAYFYFFFAITATPTEEVSRSSTH